ncbi:MAG TPA: hypothetical protein VGW36_05990, partial [Pyrinomonadaceae bacterium]|nr:hypothetical protein [Pyrinomonadaceae bacterium]
EGLENVEEIARQFGTVVNLPFEEIKKYLRENITFQVDESLEEGLHLFFKLAEQHSEVAKLKPMSYMKPFSATAN